MGFNVQGVVADAMRNAITDGDCPLEAAIFVLTKIVHAQQSQILTLRDCQVQALALQQNERRAR